MKEWEVMRAFEQGRQIQEKCYYLTEWEDIDDPEWDWVGYEYRVKPKPKTKMYQWVFKDADGVHFTSTRFFPEGETGTFRGSDKKAVCRADWTMIEVEL